MLIKIVINGYPESGKNTFVGLMAKILKRENKWLSQYDTVGVYKDMLVYNFGWDEKEKSDKVRRAISDLKRIDIEFRDGPFVDLAFEIDSKDLNPFIGDEFLFIHCREPNEIKKIKDKYQDTILLKIERGKKTKIYNNASDMSVNNIGYDYVIENNGTMDDLMNEAENFYKWVYERRNKWNLTNGTRI